MSAVTASLCSTLMFVLFVSADQKNITAESGQDVTMTCRAPNNNIIVVEWSRADLKPEFVFVYRSRGFDPDNQHPSFKNRVDLQDRQMKDGDVSLILKDVTINDTGTYECRVVHQVGRPKTLISVIHLHVDPPGQTGGQEKDEDNKDGGKEDRGKVDGSVLRIVVLSVPSVLLVAAVGFRIYRRCKLNPADPHVAEHLQPEYQKDITAKSGQDVTLTCQAPHNKIRAVEWSRTDLGDENVLLYLDGHFVPDDQDPSFKNRVDLQDRQMKNGDVSLILKNVTINDTGTYECHVVQKRTNHRKKTLLNSELISSIYFKVLPPDEIITAESGQAKQRVREK